MPINNLTNNPLLTLTVTASDDLPTNRFVDYAGGLCAANGAALGATELAWLSGESASVIVQGIAILETEDALFAGDDVCVGTDGKAAGQGGSFPVMGRAMQDAAADDFVRVLLIH